MNFQTALAVGVLLVSACCGSADEPVVMTISGRNLRQADVNAWYSAVRRAWYYDGAEYVQVNGSDTVYLNGKISQVLDDRVLLDIGKSSLVALSVPTNAISSVVDGQAVTCLGMSFGRYEYVNVLGANVTIPHYVYMPLLTYTEFLAGVRRGYWQSYVSAPTARSVGADKPDRAPIPRAPWHGPKTLRSTKAGNW